MMKDRILQVTFPHRRIVRPANLGEASRSRLGRAVIDPQKRKRALAIKLCRCSFFPHLADFHFYGSLSTNASALFHRECKSRTVSLPILASKMNDPLAARTK